MPAHDAWVIPATARSWIGSANDIASDFPIQNLPFAIFSTAADPAPRVGVAIGDLIADLAVLEASGLISYPGGSFVQPSLNQLIAQGRSAWRALRVTLATLFAKGSALADDTALCARALIPQSGAVLHLPVQVGNFTDFYASRHHAFNAGSLFRDPAHALLANWSELPVGYAGRASTIVVGGTPVRRPLGQIKRPDSARPVLAATEKLDFELELGAVIGVPSIMGERIGLAAAESHIFGVVLLNDWSARDIQQWESQPLGPFNAKNFATSISPWVVTLDALEPLRCAQPTQEPLPLDHLLPAGPGGFDITLELSLRPAGVAAASTIVRTNFRHMYWTMAQQVAHHTVGGCNLAVGDLLGSGTISGPDPHACGCLLEQTFNGSRPLILEGGVTRRFVEDGDTVTLSGYGQLDNCRIGFGVCATRILPAAPFRIL